MELLLQPADRGYPAEYLLTRIRGRRSRLIAEWKQLIYESGVSDYLSSSRYQGLVKDRSAENLWCNLVREYRWVYLQMNGRLRKVFAPFFLYTELRTLFISLRHLKGKNTGKGGELLESSILSREIKNAVTTSADVAEAVRRIEPAFVSLSPRFAGLAKTVEENGLREFEQQVTDMYLAVTAESALQPALKQFFAWIVDSRNLLGAYKYLRLEEKERPPFISGGAISRALLDDVVAKGDLFGICTLIRKFFGSKIDSPDPTKVEMALYRGITQFLRKQGREPFGVAPILDYLWRCSLEVMNLGVLIQGRDLEREAVAAELVR